MTTTTDDTATVVREFWRLMATNDFHAVKAVLSEDFVLEWPQSNERIRGGDNFARLNAAYPADGLWSFTINRIVAGERDATSDVSVTDGVARARAITFFSVENRTITKIVEFWPEPYDAPFDRSQFVERLD
ncbi:nuclear transport factor 2 family protein [Burkholderia sp. Ac-20353]|uniref:nuclear transport factor 2 family protein n=1 Tax=Burkholderia sp. Ac-20353 TaxID=2703894 RepID=UPI00197B7CED|nr:nuclear transport factor 2 family protein [Burkholderia sp. Ac-20353]MBN3786670.1 nuclear transport factor 2 family protein [Burkholderia sp. Ac-20353]